jgi:hypothetical protein
MDTPRAFAPHRLRSAENPTKMSALSPKCENRGDRLLDKRVLCKKKNPPPAPENRLSRLLCHENPTILRKKLRGQMRISLPVSPQHENSNFDASKRNPLVYVNEVWIMRQTHSGNLPIRDLDCKYFTHAHTLLRFEIAPPEVSPEPALREIGMENLDLS